MSTAPLTRVFGWPTRLAFFIGERHQTPFAWGSNDCCLFAADAIERMTGVDLAADMRGRYHTRLGAMRMIRKHDKNVRSVAVFPPLFGLPEQPIKQTRRGDLVMIESPDGWGSLAICVDHRAFAPGVERLREVPIEGWRASWRVA